MEAALHEALELSPDDLHVEGAAWLTARGLLSLVQEERSRALEELDRGMSLLRQTSALPYPMRAVWALVPTVEKEDSERARQEVQESGAALLPVNRAIVEYAEAVARGQTGDRHGAERAFERAEALVKARPGASGLRFLSLRLVAEAALHDRWGDPVDWLKQASAGFETGSHDRLASASRGLLRQHAAQHSWFEVQKLDARSHFPMFEVPHTIASAIERFIGSDER
jgi:hypothetical protein